METVLKENLSGRCYVLSGKKAHFHRYCDTGFKSKWTGLWSDGKKFLDYFAIRINGEWLSPANCRAFEQSEMDASHSFALKGLDVRESLFVAEGSKTLVLTLGLENVSGAESAAAIEVEAAVNIRDSEENWHDRTYETKAIEGRIIVNSSKGSVVFGGFPSGRLDGTPAYRDHHPGEVQRCLVPGNYRIDAALKTRAKQNIYLMFSCGDNELEALSNYFDAQHAHSSHLEKKRFYADVLDDSLFETGMKDIERLFKWSVIDLEKLAAESGPGFGYFAGFPWYTQFWGRDSCWMIPAMVDAGRFEEARKALTTLSKFQSFGRVPNVIYPDGTAYYNSADATLLWMIAIWHYFRNSGDDPFLGEMKDSLLKALEWCGVNENVDGLMENDGKETWMDTLERRYALEIQVFWTKALESASNIFGRLGDAERSKELERKARRAEENLKKRFWDKNSNFFLDRMNDSTRTINAVFPLFFGVSKDQRVLQRLESGEFSSGFGVRSVSKEEEKFIPSGYHTGSSWGWLTAMMACVEFRAKKTEAGLRYLKVLSDRLDNDCVSAISEAWNSENGSPVLFKKDFWEEGACMQGWSSAMIVRCVDEFMLGIDIDAPNKTITVSPSLSDGKVLRRKRIGNDFVDLVIEKSGKRLDVSYSSRDKNEYRIVLPPSTEPAQKQTSGARQRSPASDSK